MIPVLYPANATDFSSFGLGVLTDTISCEVTEERNGVFECLLKYPVSGQHYGLITRECIFKAKPNDTAADQAFRIYRITKPLNGIVTIYGQHISYDLANVPVLPFSTESQSPQLILSQLLARDTRFTGWTDYSDAKAFSVTQPKSVRACLGGTDGSMLSKWHGEFEWDNFTVKFHSHRGQKTGVVIEYGKNLTALEQDEDNSGVYTALLPYVVYTEDGSDTETVVTLTEVTLPIVTSEIVRDKTLIMDFSGEFESGSVITEEELRAKANAYISANPLGTTIPTVTVSFEPLWKQPEYSALLERVNLCDTVTIRHSALGVSVSAMVIQTVYDTLAERYVSISLGQSKSSMITTISEVQSSVEKVESSIGKFPKLLQTAISKATGLITGQSGGYVVINTDSDSGQPYELLILDAPSIDDAVNVWRWNVGGLGFSKKGYNGPYETAITADGQIVADFITSGSLVANIIKAGVIQSQDGSSYWDLETGEVVIRGYASSDAIESVTRDIEGLDTTVSNHSERLSEFQSSVDGLNSYVSGMTETMQTLESSVSGEQQKVLEMQHQVSELQHSVEGLSVSVQEQFAGGINYIKNSAGLNGVTDDWETSGVVTTDNSTDVQSNTTSDSCFVLGDTSTLMQTITGVVPGAYTVSVRAKKTGADYTSYFRVQYNGNKYAYLFNTTETFGWTEYSAVIDDVQDGTIIVYAYNRLSALYLSDLILAEGNSVHKWTPAPNEIYTTEVKIDRRGIEVSNNESAQRTVINNTEFSGYYNEEKIFTLNKDETVTKKTTVDGELTVGKTKFVPMPTASEGLNIVILD
ncbi:MAG: phage tail spike protein [Eubacteriales bacterium]|nr:phage tail spike protein [Eubacteriales bacterium]